MSGMIQAIAPRSLPKGLPQVAALLIVLLVNWLVFSDFFALRLQDGRLFGSLVDVLNRGAPVAILALGMTLVIATRGIDLSVGAVMAIAGALAATLTAQGYPLPVAFAAAAGIGLLCGLWNGILVAVLEIQPFVGAALRSSSQKARSSPS
jgi:simple sugar transport system permease protein